jgi:hypothetical protein
MNTSTSTSTSTNTSRQHQRGRDGPDRALHQYVIFNAMIDYFVGPLTPSGSSPARLRQRSKPEAPALPALSPQLCAATSYSTTLAPASPRPLPEHLLQSTRHLRHRLRISSSRFPRRSHCTNDYAKDLERSVLPFRWQWTLLVWNRWKCLGRREQTARDDIGESA